jgi:hypothetical protein
VATLNGSVVTLADHAKRLDPDGKIASVVELLSQSNQLLQDAHWEQGNLPTGHRYTSRVALPGVGFRRFNEGTPFTKSRTAQLDETCGMITAKSALDCQLSKLNDNSAAFRASEDAAFLQAMNNQVEQSLFYSSTLTAPEEIMGLTPRFASTTQAMGGSQIVLNDVASETDGSDQASIWFVGWGPRKVYGIFPKGSQAGLEAIDMGVQYVLDSGGTNTYRAYVTEFNWRLGLVVEDFRYVSRVANIDTSVLAATGATDYTLIPAMIRAYHKIYKPSECNLVCYMNRTVATYLHLQAASKVVPITFSVDAISGRPVMNFMGVPIHITDGLNVVETEIA